MVRTNFGLIGITLVLAACQTPKHPAHNYVAASNAFTNAVKELTRLRDQGRIDAESQRKLTPIINAGNEAFREWRKAIDEAKDTNGDGYPDVKVPDTVINVALRTVDALVAWQFKLEGGPSGS